MHYYQQPLQTSPILQQPRWGDSSYSTRGKELASHVMAKRMLSPLRPKPVWLSTIDTSIPQHELVDEELWSTYDYKRYYPTRPGEILGHH